MDKLSDIRSVVQSDLNIGSETSLYPQATVDLAINRAYRKIAGMFPWPETEDAKKTSTVADQEYYDYPDTWRPDSIWKLTVDGEDLGDPLLFRDYLNETENDFPNGENSIWSNQWRRFFIRIDKEAPTTNGNNNISIWGLKVVDQLEDDNDVTIFSYSMPEMNDAISQEAAAILRAKGEDEQRSMFRSAEALKIVTFQWNRIKKSQAKYEKVTPMFDVPDFFARGRVKSRTRIGNF